MEREREKRNSKCWGQDEGGGEVGPQRALPGQRGTASRQGAEHPLPRPPTSQHQQQVLQAVERAKQVTVGELNSLIGVSAPCRSPALGRPHPRGPGTQ